MRNLVFFTFVIRSCFLCNIASVLVQIQQAPSQTGIKNSALIACDRYGATILSRMPCISTINRRKAEQTRFVYTENDINQHTGCGRGSIVMEFRKWRRRSHRFKYTISGRCFLKFRIFFCPVFLK